MTKSGELDPRLKVANWHSQWILGDMILGTEVLAALTPTVYNTSEQALDRFEPEGKYAAGILL